MWFRKATNNTTVVPDTVKQQTTIPAKIEKPKDAVKSEELPMGKSVLKERARNVMRDVHTLLTLTATHSVPLVGQYIGFATGTMKMIKGAYEIKEGNKYNDKHEIIDGFFDIFIAATMASTALLPIQYKIPSFLGGAGLILTKIVYDHPKELLLSESKNIVCDAGRMINREAKETAYKLWYAIKKPFSK